MAFANIADAFNYWNGKGMDAIERRAQEIRGTIETDPNVDIKALNLELTALNQAADNAKDKAAAAQQQQTDPDTRALKPFGIETRATDWTDADDVRKTPEYRTAFFKQLQGKQLNAMESRALNAVARLEQRADAYGTSANNGGVIPTQTLNEIVKKAGKANGLFNEVRKLQVPAGVAVPVANPATPAKWNTEGANVDSEATDVPPVKFDGFELIKVFSVSAKVRTMAVDAFESYLTDELNNSVVEAIADAIVNGTGSGQPTGVLGAITNKVTTKALTYADIVKAMGLIKGGYQANSVFAMSSATLYNYVYNLVDGNKRPIFIQDAQADTIGRVLGKPVVVDDHIADGTIIYGDFKDGYAVNLANGISVESSTESSFKSGRVDYRALCVTDAKPLIAEAFASITITPGA